MAKITILMILVLALVACSVRGQCPDSNWSGSLWSTLFGTTSGTSAITIPQGTNVLFDVSSATVYSLSISGSLVFKTSGYSQSLTVGYIRVEPTGSLIVGSPNCPIPFGSKTIITFTGNRSLANTMGANPADGVYFGDKGLGVCNDNNGNGGTLNLYGQVSGPSWVRLTATANPGDTSINVDSAVNWNVGDQIIVATTDYSAVIDYRSNNSFPSFSAQGLVGIGSPDQSEVMVVASVTNGGMTVNLVSPLQYMHWGQGYERAEVGLLTRTIVLQGNAADSTDSFGGHVMIRNASNVAISGIEVTRMGQKGVLGRYPIHFHLLFEHSIGMGFFVANNSIHNNFQRCVTIHGSDGIVIANNVAYMTNGHCYFLEDGPEELNIFDSNLGISPQPVPTEGNPLPPVIPSDVTAAVFWITNPNNTYTNNAAVGGCFGYWWGMPETPTGPSAAFFPAATTNMRPRQIPLFVFENNVAHSNILNGLEIDNMPNATLQVNLEAYTPLQGPYVVNGTILATYALAQVEAVFQNTISYKNRGHGIWSRGGPIRHTGATILDNMVGFNNPPGPSLLENTQIWGESDNLGTPRPNSQDGSRQNPSVWSNPSAILGHETYDNGGPQFVRGVEFYALTNEANRPGGAFGPLQNGPYGHQTRNRYHTITWGDDVTVRASIPPAETDGPKCATWYITDGSVIPELGAGGWILSNVTPGQIMLYPNASACVGHTDWNGFACPIFGEGYIQLTVQFLGIGAFAAAAGPFTNNLYNLTNPTNNAYTYTATFRRAQFYRLGSTIDEYHPVGGRELNNNDDFQFLVNVPPRNGYYMQLINGTEIPKITNLAMTSSVGGDWMIMALPYPLHAAPFNITYTSYSTGGNYYNVLPVNSTDLLQQLTYYWDGKNGLLYIWMENVQLNSWNINWGFTDYNYDGGEYLIIAEGCSTASCGLPPSTAVSSVPSIPSIVYTYENTYRADLIHNCDSTNDDGAVGSAWFYLDPVGKNIEIAIYHNRPDDVQSVTIIDQNRNNRLLVDLSATLSSPIRRVIPFSYDTWTSLALGQLQIVIAYAAGTIGGNPACEIESDCVLPPALPNPTQCDASEGTPGLSVLSVFEDGPLPNWPRWQSWSWSASFDIQQTTLNFDDSQDYLCGNSSIGVGIQNGALVLGYPGSNATKPPVPNFYVNTTIYKYFEFWVIPEEQYPSIQLQVYFSNGITTWGPVTATAEYVLNYLIENTGWTRVRIPMSAFGIFGNVLIQSITIRQTGYSNTWAQFYLDNIVFTNGNDGATMTAGFNAADLVLYTPDACKNLVGGSGGGGGSASSSLSSWVNVMV